MVVLVNTRHVLDATLPVTQLLQGKGIDIMDGTHLMNSLKKELVLIRNSVDTYHDMWYEEALHWQVKLMLMNRRQGLFNLVDKRPAQTPHLRLFLNILNVPSRYHVLIISILAYKHDLTLIL